MDPRDLIPVVVDVEPTPMGRRPLNPWVMTGAGGGPYEPTGWYPSRPGNRLAPGYDGIGPARSQAGFGPARSMVGLNRSTEGMFSMSLRELELGSLGQEDDAEIPPPRPQIVTRNREENIEIDTMPAGMVLLGVAVGIGIAFYIAQR